MSDYPPRPSGTDEESVFHQSTHDKLHGGQLHINNTATIKASKTTKGWFLHAKPSLGGGPPPTSTTQDFTIISIQGDYITATNNKTQAIEKVAKNYKLRNSIIAAGVDGAAWTYTYSSTTARRAANLNYAEYQRVSPRYLVGDIIYADKPGSTGVSGVDLLDQNRDGRTWSAKTDQTTP